MAEKDGKNVGGRPRKSYDFAGLEFKPAPDKVKVNMSDRKEVETFCGELIEELQSDFKGMKDDVRVILNCLREIIQTSASETGKVDKQLLETFEKHQNRYRHLSKDQSAILAQLMKQFELFSQLDRPPDDDPIFTPVELVIEGEPPAEVVVENKFSLAEDDLEPGRA